METISELNSLWQKILASVNEKINDNKVFDAFLGDSYIYSYSNNEMIIGVSSKLAVKVLSEQYHELIQLSAKEITGNNIKIKFQENDVIREHAKTKDEEKPEFFVSSIVNQSLTFDNFVVGSCNREAKQAAVYIASMPKKSFNPLFLYADSGLGKTHLLFAIYNHIRENMPNKKALYCTTDDFMEEFIKSVTGEKSQEKLKNYITSFDVLLIDDIQSIAGKKQTENFFFQVFTRMYNTGKQIVITSDKHPSELKGFAERLTTRFASGLTMSINAPDVSTCVSIIKSKIEGGPLNMSSFDENVFQFIAEKFSKSVRNIDEALNRLVFYTTSIKPTKYIDMDTAMEALQSLIDVKESKRKLDEQRIINVVAEYYNLTPSQLTGNSRSGNIVVARHISMYLIRTVLDTPFTRIGITFGGKDHSTVMSGVKKVEKELKTNASLQIVIQDLKKSLK